jgi:hypothetical protein
MEQEKNHFTTSDIFSVFDDPIDKNVFKSIVNVNEDNIPTSPSEPYYSPVKCYECKEETDLLLCYDCKEVDCCFYCGKICDCCKKNWHCYICGVMNDCSECEQT